MCLFMILSFASPVSFSLLSVDTILFDSILFESNQIESGWPLFFSPPGLSWAELRIFFFWCCFPDPTLPTSPLLSCLGTLSTADDIPHLLSTPSRLARPNPRTLLLAGYAPTR